MVRQPEPIESPPEKHEYSLYRLIETQPGLHRRVTCGSSEAIEIKDRNIGYCDCLDRDETPAVERATFEIAPSIIHTTILLL